MSEVEKVLFVTRTGKRPQSLANLVKHIPNANGNKPLCRVRVKGIWQDAQDVPNCKNCFERVADLYARGVPQALW